MAKAIHIGKTWQDVKDIMKESGQSLFIKSIATLLAICFFLLIFFGKFPLVMFAALLSIQFGLGNTFHKKIIESTRFMMKVEKFLLLIILLAVSVFVFILSLHSYLYALYYWSN